MAYSLKLRFHIFGYITLKNDLGGIEECKGETVRANTPWHITTMDKLNYRIMVTAIHSYCHYYFVRQVQLTNNKITKNHSNLTIKEKITYLTELQVEKDLLNKSPDIVLNVKLYELVLMLYLTLTSILMTLLLQYHRFDLKELYHTDLN